MNLRSFWLLGLLTWLLVGCGGSSEENSAPVANASPDQQVTTGSLVTLDGSASSDIDGNLLSFSWNFISLPAGSNAALSSATVVRPTFVADIEGDYELQLVVNDGIVDSVADRVTITATRGNSAPVANAGPDQHVTTGSLVSLDASASSDANGDPLSYLWSLSSRPAGSNATLSTSTTAGSSFIPDIDGAYVIQLVVNDGIADSAAVNLTITASAANSLPVAHAGPDQNTARGSLVMLDGSASSDADHDPLGYRWSLVSLPPGSTASLSDVSAAKPTITPDVAGTYVIQLIVNDGTADSAPDTIAVTATASWQMAQSVAAQGFLFDLKANGSGQAVLLWRQDEAAGSSIWARHYQEATDSWGTPMQLKAPGLDVDHPRVAVNASGDAVAVWVQYEAVGSSIWASHYNAANSTWSVSKAIGATAYGGAHRPQVAINDAGQAVVVWEQSDDGSRYNLWVNSFANGVWGIAESINEGVGNAVQGQVALDAAGKAVIVWIQNPFLGYRIHAATYDFTTGWERPQMIDPKPTQAGVWDYDSYEPKLGMDSHGNAVVVWMLQDIALAQLNSIWAIRYDASAGAWSGGQEIDDTDETSYTHQLAVDDEGKAVAIWRQNNTDNTQISIAAATYDAIGGWAAPDILANVSTTNVLNPVVATAGAGNTTALWLQYNGSSFEIRSSSRWNPSTDWGSPVPVSTNTNTNFNPGVVVFGTQKALAVWHSGGLWFSSLR